MRRAKTAVIAVVAIFIVVLGIGTLVFNEYYEVDKPEYDEGITVVSNKDNGATLTWTKAAKADGYEIYRAEGEDGEFRQAETVEDSQTTEWTDTDLRTGGVYRYRIRPEAHVLWKKVYGPWSHDVKIENCSSDSDVDNASAVLAPETDVKFSVDDGSYQLEESVKTETESKPAVWPQLTYFSSDESIATVDGNGMITPVTVGTLTVTVMTHNGFTADINVEITGTHRIPVLTFHGISTDEAVATTFKGNQWTAAISDFEEQMKYLYDNGYKTISLDEFYEWYKGERDYDRKTVVLVFDDGYYDMYYMVLPVLKEYDFKATSFVITKSVPDVTPEYDPNVRCSIGWDKIEEIRETYPNLDFQSHSYDLHGIVDDKEQWKTCTLDDFRQDFRDIEKYGFKYMAYPYGGYNKWMLQAISETDFRLAFTFKKKGYATRDQKPYEIKRLKVNQYTTIEDLRTMVEGQ